MRLLLSRGADPLLANLKGVTPMYYEAGFGDIDVIDLVFAVAPAALNMGNYAQGTTALGRAVDLDVLCLRDREKTVARLLSLGATDKAVPVKVAHTLVRAVRRADKVTSLFCFSLSAHVLVMARVLCLHLLFIKFP